ncbi:MAG: ATP-dependent Clp protease proteolytic subunit, partial [Phocaeicola sp.]
HYPLWRLIEDGIVSEDFDYDNGPTYTLDLPPDEKIDIDKNYDADKILKLKKELYTIVAEHSHTDFDKVWADSDRDYWMTAQEAKEYGIIDEVMSRKPSL